MSTVKSEMCIRDRKDAIGVQAEQNKGQFIVRDAGNDPVKQNEQLMEMIDKGADVVFLTASDPDAVTPALEALDKADIPVILLETQVKERDLAKAFISSDNYNAGKVCGEDLKEKMPDGGKLVIVEDKADQNLSEGISGFEEKIKNGGFEVVKRVDGAQTDGMTKELNEILSSGTKVEVIMCADAVSYTHLDVYKRQVYGSEKCNVGKRASRKRTTGL